MGKKLNIKDVKLLRELFIASYANKKGWDPKNLSPSQLIEIVLQKDYIKK